MCSIERTMRSRLVRSSSDRGVSLAVRVRRGLSGEGFLAMAEASDVFALVMVPRSVGRLRLSCSCFLREVVVVGCDWWAWHGRLDVGSREVVHVEREENPNPHHCRPLSCAGCVNSLQPHTTVNLGMFFFFF